MAGSNPETIEAARKLAALTDFPNAVALIVDVPLLSAGGRELARAKRVTTVDWDPKAASIDVTATITHEGREYATTFPVARQDGRIIHCRHPGIVVEPTRIEEGDIVLRGEPVTHVKRIYEVAA